VIVWRQKNKSPAPLSLGRRAYAKKESIRLSITPCGKSPAQDFHAATGERVADRPQRVRSDERRPAPRGCPLAIGRLRHSSFSFRHARARERARTKAITPSPRAEAAEKRKEYDLPTVPPTHPAEYLPVG
jgi:hypothetical protein